MRSAIIAGAIAALVGGNLHPASAQYWADAGLPVAMPFATVCYADTVHDALYVGGYYHITDSIGQYFPFWRYQNGTWDNLGRFNMGIRATIVYHDTLVVAGSFTSVNDSSVQCVAFFDGDTWHPYGSIAPDVGTSGTVSRLKVIDDVLYAMGVFSEADGQACMGLVKRLGNQWVPVGPVLTDFGSSGPQFGDIVRFQGNLVVAGNFWFQDHGIKDLMQLNGDMWEPICDDCLQGGFDSAFPLAVYKDELYVGGYFYYSSGNIGQGVIRWDGTTWRPLGESGGGLQIDDGQDGFPPYLNALIVKDSLLFIGGGFYFADHIPANHVVTWNGERFCSLGGTPGIDVTDMDFFHDTLFVGTGWNDGPAPNNISKFIGTTYQLECSSTGVEENTDVEDALEVIPLGNGLIQLMGLRDGPHSLEIYDATGRLLQRTVVQSSTGVSEAVQLRPQATGLLVILVDGRRVVNYMGIP